MHVYLYPFPLEITLVTSFETTIRNLLGIHKECSRIDIAALINSEGSAVASRYCDTFKSGSFREHICVREAL